MKRVLSKLIEDPPREDSPDLTDEQVEQAVVTRDLDDLAKLICEDIKESGGNFTLAGHELKRRGEHLYWLSRLVCVGEPDRVLIYQASWLDPGEQR